MSTLQSIIRALRSNPITTIVIGIAIVLFTAVKLYQLQNPSDAKNAYWKLGTISQLQVVGQPELSGPLELWEGEFWRIPVSAFHHGNIIHLLMNCLSLAYFGWLLNSRMKTWQYALFLAMATLASSIPEFLIEEYAIGLSGVGYAMFGVLFVMRQKEHDYQLQVYFPDWMIGFGFVWLFACLFITWFEIESIANVAHFAGFIYGWFVGSIFYEPRERSLRLRRAFCAAHLLFIPAVDMSMHPVWNGRYQWYLAANAEEPEEKLTYLNKSVKCDPSLSKAWQQIAAIQFRNGEKLQSWKTVLTSLFYNRSQEEGRALAREVFDSFTTVEDRHQALKLMEEVFGDEFMPWLDRLIDPHTKLATDIADTINTGFSLADLLMSSDLALAEPEETQNAPEIDPDAWYSAIEGESL